MVDNIEIACREICLYFERLDDFRYVVAQPEVGKNSSGVHLQGYVEFTENKSRLSMCAKLNEKYSMFKPMHMERRRGSREQARDYCMKDDTRYPGCSFKIQGVWVRGKGARTDMINLHHTIRERGLSTAVDEHEGMYIRFHAGMEKLNMHYKRARMMELRLNLRVIVLWGETGVHKTRRAWEFMSLNHPADFWMSSPKTTSWYAYGYVGQSGIILDDFRDSYFAPHFFLRLLDIYPVEINVSGSGMVWDPSEIIITSNDDPGTWWQGAAQSTRDAVFRRIHHVEHVTDPDQQIEWDGSTRVVSIAAPANFVHAKTFPGFAGF